MELLKLNCMGQPLRLEGSMAGWQALFFNNKLVSQKSASSNQGGQTDHEFYITLDDQGTSEVLHCRIQVTMSWQPCVISYKLFVNDELLEDGQKRNKVVEELLMHKPSKTQRLLKLMNMATLGIKLLKSAKVIQLFLAAASLAVYSWLFSLSFSLILIASLAFHEFGLVTAMRHFGIATKGMYLIPFVGGCASYRMKAASRWQAVAVPLTGSSFGLLLSVFYMLLYGITGSIFFGALAAFNALLNLFNLLPVLPLAGGQVLKHISFSMTSKRSIGLWALVTLTGCYWAFQLDLLLLALLMLTGCTEIILAWQQRQTEPVAAMNSYGQAFSATWYLLLVACYTGIIWFFAGMGDDMLGLPLKILYS